MADLLKLTEEYNAIEGDEAREAYIHSRKQKVQDIVSVIHQSRRVEVMLICLYIFQHSTLCESWARSQNHERELELRQLRDERKAA